MSMFVVISHCAGKRPTEIRPVKGGQRTHEIVEQYQRELSDRNLPTGVVYQSVDGNIIDAMIAAHRLESMA